MTGLFPGLVFYLTFWYRQNERSLRVAIILASSTLAGAFGGAIAYGTLLSRAVVLTIAGGADSSRHITYEPSARALGLAVAVYAGP